MSDNDLDDPILTAGLPADLPETLFTFAKVAIAVQPEELLLWSAKYFAAVGKQEETRLRIRRFRGPLSQSTSAASTHVASRMGRAVTPEDLKAFVSMMYVPSHQAENAPVIENARVQSFWCERGLSPLALRRLFVLGKFTKHGDVDVDLFVALACTMLTVNLKETLSAAMRVLCDPPTKPEADANAFDGRCVRLLTPRSPRVSPRSPLDVVGLPYERVKRIFLFLCELDQKIDDDVALTTLQYFEQCSTDGFVTLANVGRLRNDQLLDVRT